MDTLGTHLLVEYHGIDCAVLNDVQQVESFMLKAAQAAGATVVNSVFHRFQPQGVSGVVVIEESHLSIHTWPEKGYAAVDFYTCGECVPERSHAYLCETLRPTRVDKVEVKRGLTLGDQHAPQPSMLVGELSTTDARTEDHSVVAKLDVSATRKIA